MPVIAKDDWVPRYEDAGYQALIDSLAPQMLSEADFVAQLNTNGALPDVNLAMLYDLLAELNPGNWVLLGDTLPTPPVRPARPTGLGTDATSLWFSEPTENLDGGSDTEVRFYVNGTLALAQRLDLATNRSVALADLGLAHDR
jgi:hypothetical protein